MKRYLWLLLAFLPFFVNADGVPSRPRFNSVGVGQAAPAGVGNITASGTINAVTAVQVNGVAVPTETSGTESLTLQSGCTTTPAVSAFWRKIGTFVTIRFNTVSCTGNNTTIQYSAVSAGIRPTTNSAQVTITFSCNAAQTTGLENLSTGGIWQIAAGPTTTCATGTLNMSNWSTTYSTAF